MPAATPARAFVLVVQDQPLLAMLMVHVVEEAGCKAVEARTVDEAIALLEVRTDIRVVFTDLDMRGSTAGMRFAVAIRERWPPIELVMVASLPWLEKNVPERGILLGKPFDCEQIEATLRAFVA